jgi:hypothetical protein
MVVSELIRQLGTPTMTSILEKLTSRYGSAQVDDSGQRVFHVTSPHILLQASGYLKHVLGNQKPCSVLFRGQDQLYPALTPTLYRNVKSQKMKVRRDAALKAYLNTLKAENKVLRAIPDCIREPLLQHYGIRTKWLDLVDNVWVALWFACHTAKTTGVHGEYLHFERRDPGFFTQWVYVLLLRSDASERSAQPGLWTGEDTELVDLRVAAPSTFLRPHAQHAVLLRRSKGLDHTRVDYSDFVVGIIRAELSDALSWLGSGTLLSTHALFPPAHYDFGYHELLQGAAVGNKDIGAVHHVGA